MFYIEDSDCYNTKKYQMPTNYNFILIDDAAMNNLLTRLIIKKAYPDSNIVEFTDPQKGFEYIVDRYSGDDTKEKAILILDIYMPVMDGWDFLTQFEQLDAELKQKINVYILTSSISKIDYDRADDYKNIYKYYVKPFTEYDLAEITNDIISQDN
jgi:CheY-like chemotaxis protein